MNRMVIFGVVLTAATAVAWSWQDAQEASFEPSEEMLAAMAPGPMHAKLEPLIGSWTMAGKWRMGPEQPWDEFSGDVEREWIMDGRQIKETVDSEWMGQPFTGMALIGHDNVRGEFNMVWVDNMSTGTYLSAGRMDDSGKIVFEGENSDPMTGEKNRWGKSVVDMSNANEHVIEMWSKDESGTPFVAMQMTMTRK